RIRSAVEKLDLSDEQREKIKSIQQKIREQAGAIRAEAQGNAQAIREKMQDLASQLRAKLRDVLTPEQQQKLRELMGASGDPSQPASPPMSEPKPDAPKGNGKPDGDGKRAMAPPGSQILRVGQEAPAFALERLDGRNVQLSSFNGKVLVLLFG